MRQHVRDEESQSLLKELNDVRLASRGPPVPPADEAVGRPAQPLLFHAPASAAPWPRIERANAGRVQFLPEAEAWESLDAHRVKLDCPTDLYYFFTSLTGPRLEVEAFERNAAGEHDIIGTTYLHPDFTLAQRQHRRPVEPASSAAGLLEHFRRSGRPASPLSARRLRLLLREPLHRPGPGRHSRGGPVRHRSRRHAHLARQDRQRDDHRPGTCACVCNSRARSPI